VRLACECGGHGHGNAGNVESVGCLHLLFSSFNDFAISSSKHYNSTMYQSYGLEVQIMDPHE